MACGFVAMGLLRGNSAFASKIDALIATADQFDRGEGPRAVASSAVVVRWYIDRPGRCRHAIHTGKGSLRPLRSQPLERLWFLASGSGALSREEQEPGARTVAVHCALAARCAAAPLRRPYARCSERIAALAGMTHPPDIRTDSKAPPERRARRHSAARQPCRVAGGKQSLRGRGRAGHRAGYRA